MFKVVTLVGIKGTKGEETCAWRRTIAWCEGAWGAGSKEKRRREGRGLTFELMGGCVLVTLSILKSVYSNWKHLVNTWKQVLW